MKRNEFYKKQSHSVIVDGSRWKGRVWDYYTKDSLQVISATHYGNKYSPHKIDVTAGDSIVKAPCTLEFSVFKKDEAGQYYFHNKYTYGKDTW